MRLILLLSIACCLPMWTAEDSGVVSLRPALALVLGLEPGSGFSLKENANSGYQLQNSTSANAQVLVQPIVPVRHPWQYELGYEPAPEAAWFSVDPGQLLIVPGETQEVDLRAQIPDDPAYANRHWMLYVESGPPENMAMGTVLKLRARVFIETMPAPPQDKQLPTGYANLAPSVIMMQPQEDGTWVAETSIGHDADEAVTYDLLRVPQLWGDDLAKAHRYFQQPNKAVLTETWAQSEQQQWTVEPGIWQTIRFTATPGEIKDFREEIVFFARRSLTPDFVPEAAEPLPKAEARALGTVKKKERLTNPNVQIRGVLYDHVELLRLRYYAPKAKDQASNEEGSEKTE